MSTYVCPSDPRSGQFKTPPAGSGALTCYVGVVGNNSTINNIYYGPTNGAFDLGTRGINIASMTDGTSNTIMVGERPPAADLYWGWWTGSQYDTLLSTQDPQIFYTMSGATPACSSPGRYGPGNPNFGCHSNHFYSMHPGGANWLMADGAVRFIPYSAQAMISNDLATRNGGETGSVP